MAASSFFLSSHKVLGEQSRRGNAASARVTGWHVSLDRVPHQWGNPAVARVWYKLLEGISKPNGSEEMEQILQHIRSPQELPRLLESWLTIYLHLPLIQPANRHIVELFELRFIVDIFHWPMEYEYRVVNKYGTCPNASIDPAKASSQLKVSREFIEKEFADHYQSNKQNNTPLQIQNLLNMYGTEAGSITAKERLGIKSCFTSGVARVSCWRPVSFPLRSRQLFRSLLMSKSPS